MLLDLAHAASDPRLREDLLGEVVVLNLRVADAVASRYRDRGVPQEDLQQAAYEGLLKAVHRFDPALDHDLLSFAVPTIRGEVQRHFRDRSWMVRPPRRLQELQARARAATGALTSELGRAPSRREVCARLGVGEAEHAEAMAAIGCFRPTSLDQHVGGTASTLGDLLADDRDDRAAAEARCLLGPALRMLSDRDRRILSLRFDEGWSQQEIAVELGVTQAQVSRLVERILRDLRSRLDDPRAPVDGPVPRTA